MDYDTVFGGSEESDVATNIWPRKQNLNVNPWSGLFSDQVFAKPSGKLLIELYSENVQHQKQTDL